MGTGITIDIALKIKAKNGILQSFIDERGWTQSDFARHIGVCAAEAGHWFNMTGFPKTAEKMLVVVNLVGRPAEEIFPSPIMDKDWLTGTRDWTIHRQIDPECLPIHHVKSLPHDNIDMDSFDLRDKVNEALGTLTPIEARVIRLRLGLDNMGEHSLDEAGKELGISRERIRQIETKAMRKLRHQSRAHIFDGWQNK